MSPDHIEITWDDLNQPPAPAPRGPSSRPVPAREHSRLWPCVASAISAVLVAVIISFLAAARSPGATALAFAEAMGQGQYAAAADHASEESLGRLLRVRDAMVLTYRQAAAAGYGTPASPWGVDVATLSRMDGRGFFALLCRQMNMQALWAGAGPLTVEDVREDGDRARVTIRHGRQAAMVMLVKERGRWRVDVTPFFPAFP